jgi:hypothetical protein
MRWTRVTRSADEAAVNASVAKYSVKVRITNDLFCLLFPLENTKQQK